MRRRILVSMLALPLGLGPLAALAQAGAAPCVGALVYIGSFAPPSAPGPGWAS